MAHGTWETSILQRKTHHAWPHSPSATNGIAISDTVPTMTSRAWAGKQLQVLNAASEAQLLHNCIFTIIANVPARTDGALSTIIVTARVKPSASRALQKKSREMICMVLSASHDHQLDTQKHTNTCPSHLNCTDNRQAES
jgi:hypothetical protein